MENPIKNVASMAMDQTITLADTFVGVSRAAAEGSARVIYSVRTPVRNAANMGIRINRITHKGVADLLKVQAKAIEKTVEASAARLERIARADSLRTLIKDQLDMFPAARGKLAGDMRATWKVIYGTGAELGGLFREEAPKTARKAAKKRTTRKRTAARTPAKSRSRARKTTARRAKTRTAARKTTRRVRKAA